MQFTLSTIFLIFFHVAATLALFGGWGVWIAGVMLFAAFRINRAKRPKDAIADVMILIAIGIICPGLLLSAISSPRGAIMRAACMNNLKQIGLALHNYHDTNNNFPPANVCDKNGKALFSWRVEILPMLDNDSLYNALNKDEPWNSPNNIKQLNRTIPLYKCPSGGSENVDFSTNYIAIIGPGTAWREDGLVKLTDLPDGGSHTVMALESINSGVHWAEPRDLTVEEAIEGLKTGKGLRISTAHPSVIQVLLADGAVRSIPAQMSISVWEKLLAGEITDIDNMDDLISPDATDMVDVHVNVPGSSPLVWNEWTIILGVIVWLFSVVLLFRCAIKSRKKPVPVEVQPEGL
jgi:hypothetical protein